jgi:hypothetical protein
MQRLRFLSSISVALLVGCGSEGCSGDDGSCGPGDAPDKGLLAGDQDQMLTFGSLVSSANNDCPDPSAPSGVTSLTIGGTQSDGTGLLTLCIPRPDMLAASVPLGGAAAPAPDVRIIDLSGTAMGCDYAFESARPVSGTVLGRGVCDNGNDSSGYALVIDGHISVKRTCPTSMDTIAVNFNGTVAVAVH